ncbi:MAG: radical SAM protein [Chitinivibrionales bacterium]|nr:radical SAM protein [Chitinivibrionales bacterium]
MRVAFDKIAYSSVWVFTFCSSGCILHCCCYPTDAAGSVALHEPILHRWDAFVKGDMMRIAFVSPRAGFTTRNKSLQQFWDQSSEANAYRAYWTGLGSGLLVLAALTPPGHEVTLVDENYDDVDLGADYDIVAITCMTQQAVRAYEIADAFRSKGSKVVVGGIHPTVMTEEAANHADAVVVGEAEDIWPVVLKDAAAGQLRRVYRSSESPDLRRSPCPRFDVLDTSRYPLLWLQASRGCPHDCDYCAASKIYGRKYRTKAAEQVLKEVEAALSLSESTRLAFADDNFLVDRSLAADLLSGLRGYGARWHAQCDVSIARDDNLLRQMSASGCTFVFVGFESLSSDSLASIDKTQWKARQTAFYAEAVERIQSHGIGVMGAFMVGFDGDGKGVFQRVGDFILKTNMYAASITILTPLPGTRLRAWLQQQGRLLPGRTWNDYTAYNVNHELVGMSEAEMYEGLTDLYRRVYSQEAYETKMEYFKRLQRSRLRETFC